MLLEGPPKWVWTDSAPEIQNSVDSEATYASPTYVPSLGFGAIYQVLPMERMYQESSQEAVQEQGGSGDTQQPSKKNSRRRYASKAWYVARPLHDRVK